MSSIERARERFEVVPREIDDELDRYARGDRGCAGDVVSGIGAIATLGLGVLTAAGLAPLLAPFVGITMLVIGYLLSSRVQRRSSDERMAALEAGPLVTVHLIDPPPRLADPGRATARVVGVFCTGEDQRHAASRLERVADQLASAESRPAALQALFDDEFAQGCHPVPDSMGADPDTFAARVVVYQERLEDRRLRPETPQIPCIVDPPRGFIEHV